MPRKRRNITVDHVILTTLRNITAAATTQDDIVRKLMTAARDYVPESDWELYEPFLRAVCKFIAGQEWLIRESERN